jgi:1,4-dihydroxy-6-naphthoate synthase
MQFKRDLSTKEADKYLSWYANERSLDMGKDGRKSVQILLNCALEKGLIPQPIKVTFV